MREIIVAPSLLSADFSNLKEEINKVEKSKATWLHFDVMDGHFVPNISFGSKVLADISKVTDLFLDVHLMISDPLKYAIDFIKAGADLLTFHLEAIERSKINDLIGLIHQKGCLVGISIKPQTPVETLLPYLDKIDLVLIMSVEPGFGGQKFKEENLSKVRFLRKYIDDKKLKCLIEIDGGIDFDTGLRCKEAGVDILVAGSYLFGHHDMIGRIESLIEK